MISLLLAGLSTVQGDTLSADRHLNPDQLVASHVGQLLSATMLLWTSAIDYRHPEACSHLDIKNSCFFLETLDGDGDSGG